MLSGRRWAREADLPAIHLTFPPVRPCHREIPGERPILGHGTPFVWVIDPKFLSDRLSNNRNVGGEKSTKKMIYQTVVRGE